jgi:hypothetical protein
MEGEISYDVVMEDDMSFVEGTYRIDSGEWSVFIFSKRAAGKTTWKPGVRSSGVGGIVFEVALITALNMLSVERLMSEALGVKEWRRVKGPDSMDLR